MSDLPDKGAKFAAALTALRSIDSAVQNEGAATAIQVGTEIVPELLKLLNDDAVNPAPVIYALAQIGDVLAEPVFLSGLRDSRERVRAHAAQGLCRIGHPEALSACLRTINDAPDELHLDMTPSVAALGGMGIKAAPGLFELMMSPEELTRLRAQRALELILSRRHGFRPFEGFPSATDSENARAEWLANGDFDYRAEIGARHASLTLWRRWLTTASDER